MILSMVMGFMASICRWYSFNVPCKALRNLESPPVRLLLFEEPKNIKQENSRLFVTNRQSFLFLFGFFGDVFPALGFSLILLNARQSYAINP